VHFAKKQNNVQAFANLHIRPIILFCRQYFLQEDYRFYFLVKSQQEKSVLILQVIRAFTISFCYHVIHDRKNSQRELM